ncbi:MFS-type transporter clz9-like [Homalodisca vitripennis]|uniref:MFS-type transporter clz9-like n=1 Tax=Homalodisca vitripennis TaxID=197043 RepID=UPI001EEBB15D|nr:MFS-type transporter clz9-like [Homalodisca vitripennis]
MDSHGSHVGPEVIELAKQNEIYLMTFPAHTSHLFQPLDVGVYKSLKSVWAKLLNNHMLLNPNNMPSRSHFHELFTPAFLESFTPLNIIHSFKKAGASPYNPNVLPAEALAPSRLTDRYGPSSPATRVRKSGYYLVILGKHCLPFLQRTPLKNNCMV